jgi:hypothetical protein
VDPTLKRLGKVVVALLAGLLFNYDAGVPGMKPLRL